MSQAYSNPRRATDDCGSEHADYPHEPGYLDSCDACRATCHCGPGVAAGTETPCVAAEHDEEEEDAE